MFLSHWLKSAPRPHVRRGANNRPRFRPAVEGLEAREVPAIISVTTTADVVDPNDGALSLREAVLQANATKGADTINVPAGLYGLSVAGADEDAAATGDLDLSGSVRIVGEPAGGTVIDAAGLDRVFHVLSGSTAALEQLTIRGGRTAFFGGGVVNEGSLTIDACAVVGNTTGRDGGGIGNLGQLTVLSSVFDANRASGAGDTNGGAISNSGDLTVRDTTFRGNTTAGRYIDSGGGAICSDGVGNISIDGCRFVGNSAFGSGGALLVTNHSGLSDAKAQVTIRSSTFDGNHAWYGGAVDLYQRGPLTTTTVTGCNFTNNSGAVTGGGWGGAITNGLGMLAVTDCLFSGNKSQIAGAIYCIGEVAIRNSRFLSNTAVESGGALFGYGNQSVSGCTFTGNRAETGGALYGVRSVSGSTFTGNSADYGGAMIVGSNGTIQNCGFTGNSALYYGGAILGSGTTDVKVCSFLGNSADVGGAVYDPGSVTGSTFTHNSARYYGGAIAGAKSVTDCVIDSNSAYLGGGGIFNTRVGLTVRNCILANNTARDGAALYNGPFSYAGWTGTASLQGCGVTGNTSEYGGAIYIGEQGKVMIQDSTLTANTSQYGGGAVVNAGELVIRGSLITSNSSTSGRSGGIYNVGTLTLRDSTVVGNIAPLGGDLFNLGTVYLFDSTVGDRYDG